METSASEPVIGCSDAKLESAYKQLQKSAPKFSIAEKQEMVIGGGVPSWTNSIPGPDKYKYDTNTYKQRAPNWTCRIKPEMVIGGGVPSWTNSIPGPKYVYNTDVNKDRQPVYTMQGRAKDPNDKLVSADGSAPSGGNLGLTSEQMAAGFAQTRPSEPKFTIAHKPEGDSMVGLNAWQRSIPGPKYKYDADVVRRKSQASSIHKKLPTEADIMKTRSPGPVYSGSAQDAKKQELVDGTRHRTPACGFGIGSRWEGRQAKMASTGVLGRYDRPRF